MQRKKIYELNQQKHDIHSSIAEELTQYDLKEYDAEFGYEFEISFEYYPPELKGFLFAAWKELDRIVDILPR